VDVVGGQWVKRFEDLTSVFAGVFAVLFIYGTLLASLRGIGAGGEDDGVGMARMMAGIG
jgi:hypothetical protein